MKKILFLLRFYLCGIHKTNCYLDNNLFSNFDKSLLNTTLKIHGTSFYYLVLLSCGLCLLNLSSSYLVISLLINHKHFSHITHFVITLFSLSITRFIILQTKLYLILKIQKNIYSDFKFNFRNKFWSPEDVANMPHIFHRDMKIFQETIPYLYNLLYLPIAIIAVGGFCYYYSGELALICLASTLIFAPISFFIAQKSSYLAEKIYRASKERIKISNFFVQYREFLVNWNELDFLKRISDRTKKENNCRNVDSLVRFLDFYIVIFGRGLPIILYYCAIVYFNSDNNKTNAALLLWISPLVISLVMEAGRLFSDYSLAKASLKEVRLFFSNENLNKPHDNRYVNLDISWRIWDTNIIKNTLENLSPAELHLFDVLNLSDELKCNTYLSRINKTISDETVSRGQRTRILLIRGIHLAIAEQKKLKINIPLDSLDPKLCFVLKGQVEKLKQYCEIEFSEENRNLINKQSELFLKADLSATRLIPDVKLNGNTKIDWKKPPSTSFISFVRKTFPLSTLLFIIPAILLSMNSYFLGLSIPVNRMYFPYLINSILSISFVTMLGYYLEKKIRNNALNLKLKFLLNTSLKNINNVFQVISSDYLVIVERITWYIHDISWYLSLTIVGVVSIFFSYNFLSLLINTLILIVLGVIFKYSVRALILARDHGIRGLNISFSKIQDVVGIGNIGNDILLNIKNKFLDDGFKILVKTQMQLAWLKSFYSNLIILIVSLLVFVCATCSLMLPISTSLALFSLSALISFESISANLFLSFTGLVSQSASYNRLAEFKACENTNTISIKEHEDKLVLPEGENKILAIMYKKSFLTKGKVYSLTGPSGSGKTQYLKFLSNFSLYPFDTSQVIYIDKEFDAVANEIYNQVDIVKFINKKIKQGCFLFLMDEYTTNYDLETAFELIEKLKDFSENKLATFLVVDHRFYLSDQLHINDIIVEEQGVEDGSYIHRTSVLAYN